MFPSSIPYSGILVHVVCWGKDLRTKLQEWRKKNMEWEEANKICPLNLHRRLPRLNLMIPQTHWGKRPASYTTQSISHWLWGLSQGRTSSQAFSSDWGKLQLSADSSQHSQQLDDGPLALGKGSKQSINSSTRPIVRPDFSYFFCLQHSFQIFM